MIYKRKSQKFQKLNSLKKKLLFLGKQSKKNEKARHGRGENVCLSHI